MRSSSAYPRSPGRHSFNAFVIYRLVIEVPLLGLLATGALNARRHAAHPEM
ncbi:hypothetical protein [Streptomyces sp. NPDC058457]|uniref:hypothetical protein n=1 Tax=Streptomyces sp. NPDC058457 TaxID=3346507 RepID=UPI00365D1B25